MVKATMGIRIETKTTAQSGRKTFVQLTIVDFTITKIWSSVCMNVNWAVMEKGLGEEELRAEQQQVLLLELVLSLPPALF